jgi:multicomponent K+:H+ antiporter subunit E
MTAALRRAFPAPLLSVVLAVLWLVLEPSFSRGNLALAALLAVVVPVVVAPLRPTPVRIRRPWTIVRLVLAVGHDVIASNLAVAAALLRPSRRPLRPAFVTIPLAIRDPNALAALATITTVVPGTVWCELARDASVVRLHVFDLDDEAAFVADYKARYEQPLRAIFESAAAPPAAAADAARRRAGRGARSARRGAKR